MVMKTLARATALLCAFLCPLLAAGCYRPDMPDCAAPCGAGNLCPADTVCSLGRCARPGTRCPAPPPPDGGPPDLRQLAPRPDVGPREPDARPHDVAAPTDTRRPVDVSDAKPPSPDRGPPDLEAPPPDLVESDDLGDDDGQS